jgi:membrane-bound ClpP family serine protease
MSMFFLGVILLGGCASAVALQSYLHKRYSNAESLISAGGTVHTALSPKGSVLIRGELWLARSATGNTIPEGSKVTVVGVTNHRLLVAAS